MTFQNQYIIAEISIITLIKNILTFFILKLIFKTYVFRKLTQLKKFNMIIIKKGSYEIK